MNLLETTAAGLGHPLAGRTMIGADVVIQVLADEGVDTIFGYSGGAILPTYDAVFRYNDTHRKPRRRRDPLIVPANEQGAGFMAAGYARASGKVGVLLVTSGPGATNTVTPVRDCMADSVPIVLICGQVPRAAIGTDAFQEAPVFNIMGACAKHVFLVTDGRSSKRRCARAFDIARSGRPGPGRRRHPEGRAELDEARFNGGGLLAMRGYQRRLDARRAQRLWATPTCQAFLRHARASRATAHLRRRRRHQRRCGQSHAPLRQAFGIPVATTLMGIGAMRHDSIRSSLHMLGMHGAAYANYAVEDCDFLIAVGARFDDRVAGRPAEVRAQRHEHRADRRRRRPKSAR